MSTSTIPCPLERSLDLRIPGVDAVSLRIGTTTGRHDFDLAITDAPFSIAARVHAVLRVDPAILRPLKSGTREPDPEVAALEVTLGDIDLTFDENGDIGIAGDVALTVPKCMIGNTGVIVQLTQLRWLSPSSTNIPAATPAGFSGVYFSGVTVEVAELPIASGQLAMNDVFLGTGGFSGTVSWAGPVTWGPDPGDNSNEIFSGAFVGELFGFEGALTGVALAFRQGSLISCEATGDVYAPYLEKRIGVTLGLDGAGGITAAAGLPHSTPDELGISADLAGYLLHVDVGSDADPFLELDIDSFRFTSSGDGPALIELSGAVDVNIDGLDAPPFEFNALRVDADGNVAIDGGWLDLREAKLAPFRGFPLEITRLGFGKEESGCFWLGLNGGIKMAEGLPVGVSVEGLRICWNPAEDPPHFEVSLKGVGLEFRIPNTLEFAGTVAFFSEGGNHGFRGSIKLTIISMNLTIDAQLVVGRTATGSTFFYIYLGVDLPTGIPLFSTGAAIYGFAGLLAKEMGPTRQEGEHWYYGWYLRDPKGVTDALKWQPRSGAFAAGIGTTIGTQSDDGYAFSAKVLLVLLLPGPTFLLTGKGKFIQKRADSQDVQQEGNFDALIVLDFPGKLFQANLAAAYSYEKLLKIEGGTDVAFSWAPSPPPDMWHVYLGEKTPMEKRIRAMLFDVLRGSSYFQLTRDGIETGTWVGLKEKYQYGPVSAWFEASVSGEASISWNPVSFVGSLRLVGSAGLSAFGVKVRVALNSGVVAKAPKPWYLSMYIEVSIEIDLYFFEFSKTVELPLTWGGDEHTPLPDPAMPVVLRLAAEHLKADESVDLNGGIIPPDGRPVLIFNRPVGDRGRLGSPNATPPPADDVGARTFSYELVHLALIRRDGGERVIAAGGLLDVSSGVVHLNGPLTLPSATGSTLELMDGGSFPVTGSGAGTLSVTGTVPPGQHAYRLQGRQTQTSGEIASVTAGAYSTAILLLSGNHGRGAGAFVGGRLEQDENHWTIISDDGTSVMVRAPDLLPTPGAAKFLASSGGLLEGQWLPVENRESASDPGPTTKLMLWARTPFVWFRRNGPDTAMGFAAQNPSYGCGPAPVEAPACIDFDDLLPGRLGETFKARSIPGRVMGTAHVLISAANISDHFVGLRAGSIAFSFEPPVESVLIRYRSDQRTAAVAAARRQGAVVTSIHLQPSDSQIELSGDIDELLVTARGLLLLDAICIRPDWICATFDEKSLPPNATGQQKVATLVLETRGTMEVNGDTLTINPPAQGMGRSIPNIATVDRRITTKTQLLPHARAAEAWRRLGVELPVTTSDVPRVPISGIRGESPSYLPGLGAVIATPLQVPKPPGERRQIPRPPLPSRRLLGRPLPSLPLASLKRLVVGSNGTGSALASLAVFFPQPVTRVRVKLAAVAEAIAYAGTREVARTVGKAGQEILIITRTDFIDRVLLLAPRAAQIQRICYDAGELGWQQLANEQWQSSIEQSIEWLYREDPILSPGDYRLEAITAVQIGRADPGTQYDTYSANFTVGPPPGLGAASGNPDADRHYPHGGPLNDLATYIESTLPGSGGRPFYRAYDVGLAYNVPYVSRMFLAAGKPLTVAVLDSNDRDLRAGSRVFWGEGETLALAREEVDWLTTLGADPETQCPTANVERIGVRTEEVSLGAGELLRPSELHAGEVRASGVSAPLYRFEFVTSRFASFVHHMASFDGRCRRVTGARSGAVDDARMSAVTDAIVEMGHAYSDYLGKRTAATTGSPTREQFDAFDAARLALRQVVQEVNQARSAAFDAVWNAYFDRPPDVGLPKAVEVARILPAGGSAAPAVLLIESPEPIPWGRTVPFLTRSPSVPLRLRNVRVIQSAFGAPDAGLTFKYADLVWTTDVELCVVRLPGGEDAAQPRVPGPWTLTMETPGARTVDVMVHVADGGSALLHGEGFDVSPDVTNGPTAPDSPAVLRVTGNSLESVRLTGSGTTLVRLAIVERFKPVPSTRDVRFLRGGLPQIAGDDQHYVEVTAFSEVDLSGWKIRWFDAATPGTSEQYHLFAAGTVLKDSEILRVYGSLTTPPTVSGVKVATGGAVGAVPTGVVVFQLMDPGEAIVHELAVVPPPTSNAAGIWAAARLAVNEDGTRAFIVPALGGTIDSGYWRLRLRMSRQWLPDFPIFSVGGNTDPEEIVLGFSTE